MTAKLQTLQQQKLKIVKGKIKDILGAKLKTLQQQQPKTFNSKTLDILTAKLLIF